MTFSVSVSGINVLVGDLRELTQTSKDFVINRMAEIAEDSMIVGAGRHRKTGALEASIVNRPIDRGRIVAHDSQYLIRAGGVDYAPFVVFGTRPHRIEPKDKKVLRWTSGGNYVFARFVNHPGYIGDNYVYRAGDDAVSQFARLVTEAIERQT